MTSMTALPLKIRPFPDESIMGFLVRLAERNGFECVSWLYELASVNVQTCVSTRDLTKLSEVSGVPKETLETMRFVPDDNRNVTFRGHNLRRHFVSGSTRRFCPDCLTKSPYYKWHWDLTTVHFCLEHQMLLIDKCPGCKKNIPWYNPAALLCSCGFDLRDSPREKVNSTDTRATEILVASLSGVVPDEGSPFKNLPYNGWVELFLVLHAGVFESQESKRRLIRQNNPDLHKILQRGYEISLDWPKNFYKLLDQIRVQRRSSEGSYGYKKSFGRFYNDVSRIQDQSVRQIVQDSFRRYILQNGDIGVTRRTSRIIRFDDRLKATYYTLKETSNFLKMHSSKVVKLINAGLLVQLENHTGKGQPRLILASSVHACAEISERFINKEEALSVFAINTNIMKQLVKRGMIRQYGSEISKANEWLVDSGEIADLLESIKNKCSTPGRRQGLVNLYSAVSFLCRFKKGVTEAVSAILNGHIPVSGIDPTEKGFRQFLVEPQNIKEYFVSYIQAKRAYVTKEQFSKLTGVNIRSVVPLMRLGILTNYEKNPGHSAVYRIPFDPAP